MAGAGIAVGIEKGHAVTKKEKVQRPANKKGVRSLLDRPTLSLPELQLHTPDTRSLL